MSTKQVFGYGDDVYMFIEIRNSVKKDDKIVRDKSN